MVATAGAPALPTAVALFGEGGACGTRRGVVTTGELRAKPFFGDFPPTDWGEGSTGIETGSMALIEDKAVGLEATYAKLVAAVEELDFKKGGIVGLVWAGSDGNGGVASVFSSSSKLSGLTSSFSSLSSLRTHHVNDSTWASD